MKKIIGFIVVLSGIIFLSGCGKQTQLETSPPQTTQSFDQQQTQDNSDINNQLKTYENKTYKFSFQYPADVKYLEDTEKGEPFDIEGTRVFAVYFGNPQSAESAFDKDAHIYVYSGAKTGLNSPAGMEPVTSTDTTIDSLKTKKYTTPSGGIEYVLVNNDHRYEIGVPESADKKIKEDFEKILPTIRFSK